jgi:hypothetical protein
MTERERILMEEALKRIKVTEGKEGFTGEDYRLLVRSVDASLKANAPFASQMLIISLLLSQALAPHVKKCLEEKNKEVSGPAVVNLTDEAKRSR